MLFDIYLDIREEAPLEAVIQLNTFSKYIEKRKKKTTHIEVDILVNLPYWPGSSFMSNKMVTCSFGCYVLCRYADLAQS